jgi:hypothetical protein
VVNVAKRFAGSLTGYEADMTKLKSKLEEMWDALCSDLGILENEDAKDFIRNFVDIKVLEAKLKMVERLKEIDVERAGFSVTGGNLTDVPPEVFEDMKQFRDGYLVCLRQVRKILQ